MGSRRRRHAALACVALGACGGESKPPPVDSRAEVTAMVAELQVREEQYKVENGTYLAAPACSDPAACGAWKKLNVTPPQPKLGCSYEITVGAPPAKPAPPAGFTMQAPAGSWYFIAASCPEATFFATSTEVTIQRVAK